VVIHGFTFMKKKYIHNLKEEYVDWLRKYIKYNFILKELPIFRIKPPTGCILRFSIVGSNTAGINSLCYRLCNGTFLDGLMNIGIDFYTKVISINDITVKNLIFTYYFGERLESTMRSNYRSLGIIFCVDLSMKYNLISLTRFTDELEKYGSTITKSNIVLVGINSDLDRVVTEDEIKTFRTKYNITSYYEVSARTGANVEEFFTDFVTSTLQRNHYYVLGKPENFPSDKLLQHKLPIRWLPFIKI